MRVMEKAIWMSSPGFEILTFANKILNCCNRYRNEPLEADQNSLDWWRAKKEEYPTFIGKEVPVCAWHHTGQENPTGIGLCTSDQKVG